MISRLPRALPAALAVLALTAAPASAESLRMHPRDLLAHTPAGAQPNAPATDPALSQDGRQVRYAAYTSAATDIAPNTSGVKNVYLVYRRAPWGLDGRRWFEDRTSLVTQGYDGTPANGDSWGPAFDGYDYAHAGREITVAPQCLAFVSAASNLVPGDTNGQADVFVKNLKTGTLRRIPTRGPATEVGLDGRCFTVAFVAGGTVYTKDIRGKGKIAHRLRRVSGFGGASAPALSANGKVATYSRNGAVYVSRNGKTRFVAPGTDPSPDDWGRFVAFVRGGEVWTASISGRANAKHLTAAISRRDGQRLMNGSAPSMTAGGHFVFFVTGNMVDSNVYELFASCPEGLAQQVAGSPHGNYATYSCSSGALYMSFVGGR
jgi:hypothetical protein